MNVLRRLVILSMAVAVLMGMTAVASAASIPLANPDFETDLAADPDGIDGMVTGWGPSVVLTGFAATFDPGAGGGAIFGAEGENNYLALAGTGLSSANAGQNDVAKITAHTTYTLTFDVGYDQRFAFPAPAVGDAYSSGGPQILARLYQTSTGLGFGELAGVTLVSSSPVPAAGTKGTWTRVYHADGAPAGLGTDLTLQFYVENAAGQPNNTILIDNVTLDRTTPTIPEPTGYALLAISGLALAVTRRRTRN